MNKKKEEPKKIKFNFYWIYAIIAVLFFGIQIFNVDTAKETSWQTFNRTMLQDKEVEKVVIVNREVAQIFLKESALDKEEHKSVSQKPFGSSTNKGPHYFFKFHLPTILKTNYKRHNSILMTLKK